MSRDNRVNGFKKQMEVVFPHFRLWVADLLGFDFRLESGMSKSGRGLILSRFRWTGAGFKSQQFQKKICSWGYIHMLIAKYVHCCFQ